VERITTNTQPVLPSVPHFTADFKPAELASYGNSAMRDLDAEAVT
jgi:hypothetical protein